MDLKCTRERRRRTLHGGYWTVGNRKQYPRNLMFEEDSSRKRTGYTPVNNAAPNSLLLVTVLRSKACGTLPEALTHFSVGRDEAMEAILRPV